MENALKKNTPTPRSAMNAIVRCVFGYVHRESNSPEFKGRVTPTQECEEAIVCLDLHNVNQILLFIYVPHCVCEQGLLKRTKEILWA